MSTGDSGLISWPAIIFLSHSRNSEVSSGTHPQGRRPFNHYLRLQIKLKKGKKKLYLILSLLLVR
jgi:hypothetical protein